MTQENLASNTETISPSKTGNFQFLADKSELKEHGQLTRWVGDHDILLYEHNGELKAISNICPHFGGPVGYRKSKDGIFTCLWHNWQFSCDDGSCLSNKGMTLREYKIKVEGEKVYVDLLG